MLFKRKVNYVDPLQVERYEHIFYVENVSLGDTIFDVGANVGELTLLFSRFAGPGGAIHAFEPTASTFNKLTSTVNNFNKKNVKLNNLAINDKSGFVTFNTYEEAYASWNTIGNRPLEKYGVNINSPKALQVPAITIDDYCFQNGINQINLLKIDVEGAELNVLAGAERMFDQKKIKLCVFEFGQTIHDMGKSGDDFRKFFQQHHYIVGNIVNHQALFPVDPNTARACFSIHFARPR